jgi:hypothetical protein
MPIYLSFNFGNYGDFGNFGNPAMSQIIQSGAAGGGASL